MRQVSRRTALVGAAAAAPLIVAACTIGSPGNADHDSHGGENNGADAGPPVTISPADGAVDVNPTEVVTVTSLGPQLRAVTVTDPAGAAIPGTLADGRWTSTGPLSYGTAYTTVVSYDTVVSDDADDTVVSNDAATPETGAGAPTGEFRASFSTFAPPTLTLPYFENTGGNILNDGAVYGVGQVAVVHFDEPITDRVAAQRTLTVTTTPTVEGSWSWTGDQTVAWRPREYYPPGTDVRIDATVFGTEVSPGLWGQSNQSISFRIGESHISVADDNTKQVEVFVAGQLVRTMPTSMGQGGTEVVNGTTLHFWTQRGIYTVLGKDNPVVMDSSTYGLPINSRLGYRQVIDWATRISNDGIYLHALDNIAAQGVRNESHGCLNLSPANAEWFFGLSQPGDVVEVRNTGGPALEQWQNGDWSVPWETWTAASAI